ncbi:trafficking protein particle complex subunit 10 [Cladochytrium replicatum]|nr:trafficking protein particle complex subunit 10 [Cladochytrium replicatum]
MVQLEEDIRRMDSQRLMPGWNYCQFFILKEGSALAYELMNLYDDALMQYDELEASFFQTLTEQGAPWFQTFGASEPEDDSMDILNLKKKPYRELIMQNQITIFDFRLYLFSRQCQLLFKLGQPIEICQRAKRFVVDFSRTLREYQVQLTPFFCESWIYSACMSVIGQTEELAAVSNLPAPVAQLYESAKAELLQYARMQLDKLGFASKLYISPKESSMSPITEPSAAETADASFEKISNADLKQGLKSVQDFDNLYLRITGAAVKGFEASRRQRTSWLLKSEIALLHYTRGQYELAAELWSTMSFKYAENGWSSIDAVLLEKLAECQKHVGPVSEYIQSLHFLVSNPSSQFSLPRIAHWADELESAVQKLDTAMTIERTQLFSVDMSTLINKIGDDDDLVAIVQVSTILPKEIKADVLKLTLLGTEGSEIRFRSKNTVIHPGNNVLRLSCDRASIPGDYVADKLVISFGQLTFHFNLGTPSRKPVYKVVESSTSIAISANLAEHGAEFLVRIKLNEASVRQASLAIYPMPGMSIQLPSATACNIQISEDGEHRQGTIQLTKTGTLALPDCHPGEIVQFSVPFTPTELNIHEHKVRFVLSFTDREGKKKLFSVVETMKITIPFSFGHSVIQSLKSTLIQFFIVGNGSMPKRITSAIVSPVEGLTELGNHLATSSVIQSGAKLSLLYRVEGSSTSNQDDKKNPIVLTVAYHTMRDEIQAYVEHILNGLLLTRGMTKYKGFLTRHLRETGFVNLDCTPYAIHDELELSIYNAASLEFAMASEDSDVKEHIRSLMLEFEEAVKKVQGPTVRSLIQPAQQSVSYSFNKPSYQILVSVDFDIPSEQDQEHVTLGDLVTLKMRLTPLEWHAAEEEIDCMLNIDADLKYWMFSGRRKQTLRLKRDQPHTYAFVLAPLQTGNLLLPVVNVETLSKYRRKHHHHHHDQLSSQPGNNAQTASPSIRLVYPNIARQIVVAPKAESNRIFIPDVPPATQAAPTAPPPPPALPQRSAKGVGSRMGQSGYLRSQ